jgi:multidrug efflux pump subunit AcrA (membrane-fusion protein)
VGWILRQLIGRAWTLARDWPCNNPWISFTVAVTGTMTAAVMAVVVLPGYKSPSCRLFTSKFGYSSVLRMMHKPFPVVLGRPEHRKLTRALMGEGMVGSLPIQVPVVPMGRILHVLVKEGDRVKRGQLMAELDSTRAAIKMEAARAFLKIALAELERVRIGSSYVLQYERPDKSAIVLDLAKQEVEFQNQLFEINKKLALKGWLATTDLLQLKQQTAAARANLREANLWMEMAEKGKVQSLSIAEATVREAELALKYRVLEFEDHKVLSPAEGTVERRLIQEGEYNQDPGKPAFLVSSDLWFEANYDQVTVGRVRVGDRTEVRFEAWPDRMIPGRVFWVIPFVRFNLGGPEATRPIRPTGTGAPEWPATYAVRIQLDAEQTAGLSIIPGLTGFSRVVIGRPCLCLPREAVMAVTGGKGLVYLPRGDRFEIREVTLGITDGDWTEILAGLDDETEVIIDGHQVLEPGDRIAAVRDGSGRD